MKAFVVAFLMIAAVHICSAQKIGVLPFEDASVGANVSTRWGSMNSNNNNNDSPNAKALREAVKDLVEEMTDKID